MRPILAILIWVAVFGTVRSYFWFAEYAKPQRRMPVAVKKVTGEYRILIATTCAAEADAFGEGISVEFRVNERVSFRSEDRQEGTSPIELKAIQGLRPGANQFFLDWQTVESERSRPQAARIRLFKEDRLIAEKVIWGESDLPLSSAFEMVIPTQGESGRDTSSSDHDH